jgi:hypothetical protein
MKTPGSMHGLSSRGKRTGKLTGPPPPPAPSLEPRAPASPLILEEETYHLLVDAGLERRFREIHEAVAMTIPGSQGTPVEDAGGAGALDRGIGTCSSCAAESRMQGPSYRIVLRCTHSV